VLLDASVVDEFEVGICGRVSFLQTGFSQLRVDAVDDPLVPQAFSRVL
jgi:hypothetical protein